MECFYGHLSPCDSELKWRIPHYFTDGKDAKLCDKHAAEFNSLHPFGPRAVTPIRKKREPKKESA